MTLLPYVQIEPTQTATACVIWLHGLGADGHDFEPIAKELKLPDNLAVRFIFPHAPSIAVTVNNGVVMPAWYDIMGTAIDDKIDITGIQDSANKIDALIEQQISRGIKTENIIIAGFSQGGAVAYECALRYPKKLGGLMALSTYFGSHQHIHFSPENKNIPIFIGHGSDDPVVPEILGQKGTKLLNSKGYHPKYTVYPMQHSVCLEEINDISAWIQQLKLD